LQATFVAQGCEAIARLRSNTLFSFPAQGQQCAESFAAQRESEALSVCWKKAKLYSNSASALSVLLRRESFALSQEKELWKLFLTNCKKAFAYCFATVNPEVATATHTHTAQAKAPLLSLRCVGKSETFLRRKRSFLTRESEAKRSCKA
jgi:hypothetical protein